MLSLCQNTVLVLWITLVNHTILYTPNVSSKLYNLQNFNVHGSVRNEICSCCHIPGTGSHSCRIKSHPWTTSYRRIILHIICVYDSVTSVTELDLDYLERRGGNTITYEGAEGGSKEEDSPADTLDRVKVIFLGAPGVGKTSIIRVRFYKHDCISQLDVICMYLTWNCSLSRKSLN